MKKCETCGNTCERWELRCAPCASQSAAIPDSYCILLARPSHLYTILVALRIAAIFMACGVLAYIILLAVEYNLLPWLLSGTSLAICRTIVFLVGILVVIACFSGAYIALQDIRNYQSFAISKKTIDCLGISKIPGPIDGIAPSETKLLRGELKLADVKELRVKQRRISRRFDWGDVEIYTDNRKKPAMIMNGIIKPFQFKEKLELVMKNSTLPVSLQTNQADTNLVEILLNQTIKERMATRFAALAGFSLLCVTLFWSAGWYRSTIEDWDYCIKNNLCFVCHKPSFAQETPDDMSKNVRLCPEHSTGWQSWRLVVYGVPATMLIYEDAPLGSGRIIQPIMRWAIDALWFVALMVCGVGVIVSVLQILIPHIEFFRWLD
jgi:hypothetical protein